jgi:tetratricopeptide (TPR) repeat protein
MADKLVAQAPSDARSFIARARMSGVFHRFASALTDLDTAAALGGDRVELDAERAAIYQALGRYDEALTIRRVAVDRHADFSALAALAVLQGERGELDEAERWFTAATDRYRRTSPFPLAILEFQRGKLWIEHDDLRRAREWCDAAVRRLGAYVPARPPRRTRRCPRGDGGSHRSASATGARIRRSRLRDAARPHLG